MRVMTCNIRFSGAEDGDNKWVYRKDFCIDVIRSRKPDIICFQEMWEDQFSDISSVFREYEFHGTPGEPCDNHPQNCIAYRSGDFLRTGYGAYWLSETPHVPGTKSWDSACIRYVNWLRLKDKNTGLPFRVINTHLDHISGVARENQARLIVEDSAVWNEGFPQILTGDMNCDYLGEGITVLRNGGWRDTYNIIHGTENPGLTFHEFKGDKFDDPLGKIDWILVRGKIKVIGAEIIKDSRNGKYPSDHYFVTADVMIEP